MLVTVLVILLVFLLPAAFLVLRFRRDEEAQAGGSLGRQLFGRRDDNWGPR